VERLPNERLGKWNFWLLFIGFNLAFFPMHISGILGMARRIYTYDAGRGLEPYNLLSTVGAFIIAASVVVFLYNMISSAHSGPKADANPWKADTLEWLPPTPMPVYGFRHLPIVHSRHPLWEAADESTADPRTEKLLQTLANFPRKYRAQLVTSAIDAQPEEIFRVADPSIWPLFTALAIAVLTLLLVFSQYALAAVALAVMLITLIGWHRDAGEFSNPAEERAFEEEYGIPLRPRGSRAVARWGMLLTIVTLATALATLAFSYFYLRLKPPQWPPAGIPMPDAVLPGIGLIVLLVSVVPMGWAARGVRRDEATPVQWGLLAAIILGLVYIGMNLLTYRQLGFGYQTQAFGSIFAVLAAFQMLTTLVGVVITAATLFGFMRMMRRAGENRPSRHQAATDIALFWYYAAAAGVVTYALLYLAPHVI
jgi:cytochrome c oxidase subunit I+III